MLSDEAAWLAQCLQEQEGITVPWRVIRKYCSDYEEAHALEAFADAAQNLTTFWKEEYDTAYPEYLPSFDEANADFQNWKAEVKYSEEAQKCF